MSRPILTSLFSKFLFRETLTSEEKGYIRSDIGAETAGAAATAQALAISTASGDAMTKANAAQAAAIAASQPLDPDLTAIAALTTTSAGRNLLTGANAVAIRNQVGAVGTPLEITTALQGVEADPTKISAEYMPDIIPVDGVTLTDTSEFELPLNTLGIGVNGRVVVHDGDTTGGVDIEGTILRGAASYTVASSHAAEVLVEVARMVLPAAAVISGTSKQLSLIGSFTLRSQLANYTPSGNVHIVLYFRDSAGTRNATAELDDAFGRVTIATAAAPAEFSILEIFDQFQLTNTANVLSASVASVVGTSRLRTLAAGVATETEKNFTVGGTTGERNIVYGGTNGFAYICIGVYLPADSATADTTGGIVASCDVRAMIV